MDGSKLTGDNCSWKVDIFYYAMIKDYFFSECIRQINTLWKHHTFQFNWPLNPGLAQIEPRFHAPAFDLHPFRGDCPKCAPFIASSCDQRR